MSTQLTPSMLRSALISALRHPETWPEGFVWNWENCQRCGMGLLIAMFTDNTRMAHTGRAAALLGIAEGQAHSIFINKSNNGDTPAVIADRLEAIHRSMHPIPALADCG